MDRAVPAHRVSGQWLAGTRASYDVMADAYAAEFHDELAAKPWERAILGAFAELVGAGGLVADVGCGPGRGTAYLAGLGLTVVGVDLSPGMVDVARRVHPELRFEVGSMTALDFADGSLAGVLAMYSIIHVPDRQLPEVFAEFHRVLGLGGQLAVVFQVGDGPLHRTEAFGRPVSLDYHWRRPEDVAELLRRAGLPVQATLVREPDGMEKVPRACLLACKAGRSGR